MSLDRLLGTWDTSMQHHAIAEPVVGRQRYATVLGGAFVLLDWTYEHPDFPNAMALLEPTAFHYFDVRGISRVFDMHVDDVGWSIIRRDSDFWQRASASSSEPPRWREPARTPSTTASLGSMTSI